jgi:hypothetical protein
MFLSWLADTIVAISCLILLMTINRDSVEMITWSKYLSVILLGEMISALFVRSPSHHVISAVSLLLVFLSIKFTSGDVPEELSIAIYSINFFILTKILFYGSLICSTRGCNNHLKSEESSPLLP